MTKGIPPVFLEILQQEPTRELLVLLGGQPDAIRYSEARRRLGMHPQAFQRALEELEELGLLVLRAPADHPGQARDGRRQVVFLETTRLGRFLARQWAEMSASFEKRAREERMSRALEGLHAEG